MGGSVYDKVPEYKAFAALLRFGHGARQDHLYAGHQLPRAERLYHIIVRAALQARKLVVFLAACRQHDDGRVDFALAHLAQAGHTVHKRHHDVQYHKVRSGGGQRRQRGGAVGGLFALEAFVLQMLADQLADAGLVVYDQNFCHNKHLVFGSRWFFRFSYSSILQRRYVKFVKMFYACVPAD